MEGWTEGRNPSNIAQNVGVSFFMGPGENRKRMKERFPLLSVPPMEGEGVALSSLAGRCLSHHRHNPRMGDSPSKRAPRLHAYPPESQVTGGREVGQREDPHNLGSQLAGCWGLPASLTWEPFLLLLGQLLRGRGQTGR